MIPSVELLVEDELKIAHALGTYLFVRKNISNDVVSLKFRKACESNVVLPPRAPPRGPSPDVIGLRKIVAPRPPLDAKLEIVAADHVDAAVVAVTFKQFGTEGKERHVWQAIVLQDDPFLDVVKEPRYRGAHHHAAPAVRILEKGLHLAVPIDPLDDCARLATALRFAGYARARTVGGDEQARGLCLPYSFEDKSRGLGAVEDDEEDGGVHGVFR